MGIGPALGQRAIVVRLLTAHGLVGLADGLWLTTFAIYLTEVQGVPARSMGAAIAVGSAVGLVGVTPLGALADRRGPREVLALLCTGRAVAVLGFLFADGAWRLAVVAALAALMQNAVAGVRVAFVYKLVGEGDQLRVLAQSRVTQHVAYAVGATIGGLVLTAGTEASFTAGIVVSAAAFVLSARITLLLPHVGPGERAGERGLVQAVTDVPFVAVVLSIAPLALCWAVLFTGLPLWIRSDTAAPRWTSAFAVVVSSVAIAALQVRFTRYAREPGDAVRAARISGASLALCTVLFAVAGSQQSALPAFAILTAGVAAHFVGELLFVAAGWGLCLRLMVKDAEAQYQTLVATVEAAIVAAGPAVMTALLAGAGAGGWLAMAALFVVPVMPVGLLVQRALRSRVDERAPSVAVP